MSWPSWTYPWMPWMPWMPPVPPPPAPPPPPSRASSFLPFIAPPPPPPPPHPAPPPVAQPPPPPQPAPPPPPQPTPPPPPQPAPPPPPQPAPPPPPQPSPSSSPSIPTPPPGLSSPHRTSAIPLPTIPPASHRHQVQETIVLDSSGGYSPTPQPPLSPSTPPPPSTPTPPWGIPTSVPPPSHPQGPPPSSNLTYTVIPLSSDESGDSEVRFGEDGVSHSDARQKRRRRRSSSSSGPSSSPLATSSPIPKRSRRGTSSPTSPRSGSGAAAATSLNASWMSTGTQDPWSSTARSRSGAQAGSNMEEEEVEDGEETEYGDEGPGTGHEVADEADQTSPHQSALRSDPDNGNETVDQVEGAAAGEQTDNDGLHCTCGESLPSYYYQQLGFSSSEEELVRQELMKMGLKREELRVVYRKRTSAKKLNAFLSTTNPPRPLRAREIRSPITIGDGEKVLLVATKLEGHREGCSHHIQVAARLEVKVLSKKKMRKIRKVAIRNADKFKTVSSKKLCATDQKIIGCQRAKTGCCSKSTASVETHVVVGLERKAARLLLHQVPDLLAQRLKAHLPGAHAQMAADGANGCGMGGGDEESDEQPFAAFTMNRDSYKHPHRDPQDYRKGATAILSSLKDEDDTDTQYHMLYALENDDGTPVALQTPSRSILFEVGWAEPHGMSFVEKPDLEDPFRCALIYFRHEGLSRPFHGRVKPLALRSADNSELYGTPSLPVRFTPDTSLLDSVIILLQAGILGYTGPISEVMRACGLEELFTGIMAPFVQHYEEQFNKSVYELRHLIAGRAGLGRDQDKVEIPWSESPPEWETLLSRIVVASCLRRPVSCGYCGVDWDYETWGGLSVDLGWAPSGSRRMKATTAQKTAAQESVDLAMDTIMTQGSAIPELTGRPCVWGCEGEDVEHILSASPSLLSDPDPNTETPPPFFFIPFTNAPPSFLPILPEVLSFEGHSYSLTGYLMTTPSRPHSYYSLVFCQGHSTEKENQLKQRQISYCMFYSPNASHMTKNKTYYLVSQHRGQEQTQAQDYLSTSGQKLVVASALYSYFPC